MFPEDIKKFVIESNKEKHVIRDYESGKRNQDIATRVSSSQLNSSMNYGTTASQPFTTTGDGRAATVGAKNLASIATIQSGITTGGATQGQKQENANMASSGGIVGTETQQTLVSPDNLQAQRSGTAAPGRRNKINMEAYQAYYNTNES